METGSKGWRYEIKHFVLNFKAPFPLELQNSFQ